MHSSLTALEHPQIELLVCWALWQLLGSRADVITPLSADYDVPVLKMRAQVEALYMVLDRRAERAYSSTTYASLLIALFQPVRISAAFLSTSTHQRRLFGA